MLFRSERPPWKLGTTLTFGPFRKVDQGHTDCNRSYPPRHGAEQSRCPALLCALFGRALVLAGSVRLPSGPAEFKTYQPRQHIICSPRQSPSPTNRHDPSSSSSPHLYLLGVTVLCLFWDLALRSAYHFFLTTPHSHKSPQRCWSQVHAQCAKRCARRLATSILLRAELSSTDRTGRVTSRAIEAISLFHLPGALICRLCCGERVCTVKRVN